MNQRGKFSKARLFFYCSISFVAGVGLASFSPVNIIEKDFYWFSSLMALVLVTFFTWRFQKIRLIALLAVFLILGIWRYSIGLPESTPDKIWYYNGTVASVSGIINNEPDIRGTNQKLELSARTVKQEGEKNGLKVSGKLLITANKYPEFNYGDEIIVNCELKAPEAFNGFAYDRYLARFNTYSVCYYPKIFRLEKDRGSRLYAKIFKFKDRVKIIFNRFLSAPAASLARAMMLGDKRGIPEELRTTFSHVGLSHIIAISGMHISILAALILKFLLAIGITRKHSFYLASMFLVLFILLIGLPASAMRAGLMGFLVLLALHLGRLNKLSNILILSCAILLFINPKLFRDDIGFQLSFLAVFGIAYLYPWLDEWLDSKKIPKLKGMRDILLITCVAQLTTLPILVFNFSLVSIIAPIANLLVLWALPFLMITLLTAVVIGFILPGLALIFFLPAELLLKYIIYAAQILEKIPYSYYELEYINILWVLLYFIALIFLVIRLKAGKNKIDLI